MSNLKRRIAATENGLAKGYLVAIGIPAPDTENYRDHSVRKPKSNGAIGRHGYKSVTWRWNVMDPKQSKRLRTAIQAGLDGTGVLYLTIDRNNGENNDRDWIDVYGYPHMPEFVSSATVAGASGRLHDGIELVVNNLTIVNDPSTA